MNANLYRAHMIGVESVDIHQDCFSECICMHFRNEFFAVVIAQFNVDWCGGIDKLVTIDGD